jgi:hypothetical protein
MEKVSLRLRRADLVWRGLQRNLPLTLVVSFVMVPSTASNIFETFLCTPFEYRPGDTRRCAQLVSNRLFVE